MAKFKGPDRPHLDINNLNIDETSEISSETADITESDISARNHSHSNGLGLGNANDITSIHSGLIHNQYPSSKLNGNNANTTIGSDFTNGSIFTLETKYFNSPKVADLKDIMMEHKGNNILKKPLANFAQSSHGSNGNGQLLLLLAIDLL
ncbi:hypothetical protein QCA50_015888 [Cerrena zonata]|uniref:Uncharacterized protein n=1 Tax=Cerrena zonata TaxID=2478898 RepID=A0AAW0FKB4_9APHY